MKQVTKWVAETKWVAVTECLEHNMKQVTKWVAETKWVAVTKWVADDGTKFSTEEDCIEYENSKSLFNFIEEKN